MKKIIAFVRTSTLKQGVSIKNQIQQIKDYAKKENLTISEIINEEGVSGDSLKRVGFDRMMDLVEKKEIDGERGKHELYKKNNEREKKIDRLKEEGREKEK